ncbi:MAG TPA: DUF3261 domain-containing protein [Gammaproteobacteria bacterium]|nr:DUF3261 domain-containing protein [Gammaproteobacteria bacterium]
MKYRYAWFLLIPLIAGCATMERLPGCIKVGPWGQVCPLPPAALPAVDANHIITVTRDGNSQTFLGRLHIGPDALRLAGFSLFGTHLFTISYDGGAVTALPPDIDLHPELVIAMLEAGLATPDEIRPRLHGLTLTVSRTADTEVRELHERGHLVARITRTGAPLAAARVDIEIPPAKLELRLTPVGQP